jgi:type II secretory pathway pseudopilin PulG
MGIVSKEVHSGFTIIEVMLFLAISGFMMLGVFVGTGSSIANQRYKDAVQDAADALKKAYSFVSDTQIELRDDSSGSCKYLTNNGDGQGAASVEGESESGRGRTSCAVYGAVVVIDKDTIQTTTLIGKDYYDVLQTKESNKNNSDWEEIYNKINDSSTQDIEILAYLRANNVAKQCDANGNNCRAAVAGISSTRKLKWEANFKKPNDASSIHNRDLALTLLIYGSPRDGSIHTLSMNDVIKDSSYKKIDYRNISPNANIGEYGVNKLLLGNNFKQQDVYFCIDSGGAGTYANHNRIVHIVKDAQSQSGIILENFDDDIADESGNPISCDR